MRRRTSIRSRVNVMKIESVVTFEGVIELVPNVFRDFRIKKQTIYTIFIHFVPFLSTSYTSLSRWYIQLTVVLWNDVLFLCSDWRSCFEIRGLRFEHQAGNLLNWPAFIFVFSSHFIQYTGVQPISNYCAITPSATPTNQAVINKVAPTRRLYRCSHEE
jgi:hypothetical protein